MNDSLPPANKCARRSCFRTCLSVHGVEGGGSPSSRVSVLEEGVAIHWSFPPKGGGPSRVVVTDFLVATTKTGSTHPTGMHSCFRLLQLWLLLHMTQ